MSAVIAAIRRGERVAAAETLRLLRRELGAIAMAGVLSRLVLAKLRGQPFGALGKPRDERDRLSRRQCGDLILLDRALSHYWPSKRRVELLRGVVLAGAGPFLDAMLATVSQDELAAAAPRLVESFFNAEGQVVASEADHFVFEVRRCRFVELLEATEAKHLTELFCEADEHYFDGEQQPIQLHRTRTLARGGASCDFRFEWVKDNASS